ncbi:MAG: DUF333 domain-containing protein [Bacteriovoracaceae bacterium]|nr:DUF333 domain-containing protein [Bacteriovoracaceae bacterium]
MSLIFSNASFSETFKMKAGKDIEIEISEINGIKYGNYNKSSMALHAFKQKNIQLKATVTLGDPASRYCKLTGGMSIILRDAKNRQYDFCKFKDGSMIDSWGLYEDH